MIPETQIHMIARQMLEKHGLEAVAQAAQKAVAGESKGEAEEAKEWRHIENAMKIMRGPHHSCRDDAASIRATLMLRVPPRAGPSHVMKLRPIVGNSHQSVPSRHD